MSLMRLTALGSNVLGGVHWTSVNINIPIWTRIHTKLQLLISIWYDLTVFVIGFCWFLFASWCDISSCQMLPKSWWVVGLCRWEPKSSDFLRSMLGFWGFVLQLVGFFVWMSNKKWQKAICKEIPLCQIFQTASEKNDAWFQGCGFPYFGILPTFRGFAPWNNSPGRIASHLASVPSNLMTRSTWLLDLEQWDLWLSKTGRKWVFFHIRAWGMIKTKLIEIDLVATSNFDVATFSHHNCANEEFDFVLRKAILAFVLTCLFPQKHDMMSTAISW